MKIILIAAVSGLGKIGDIIEVRNGYAKNFLIPKKLAICLTANNNKIFESKRQEFEEQNHANLVLANKVKDKIFGKNIIIIENASDDGRLYGSVNSANIASKINELTNEKQLSRADVVLKKPIKEIGIYTARVCAHSDVEFDVKVIVTRSESEVDALLKADNKPKNPESLADDFLTEEVKKSEKPKKKKNSSE